MTVPRGLMQVIGVVWQGRGGIWALRSRRAKVGGRGMRLVVLLSFAVVCVSLVAVGGSAAATAPCRTFVVRGGPPSVVMHKCDRVRIELNYGGQGDPPYSWGASHRPSPRILTLIHGGFWRRGSGGQPDQYWTYRARAKGHTSMTFGFTTSSYPNDPPMETFKLSVTVR